MSEPFLGEIKIVGFNFAPRNWANCDGQLLPVSQNQSLFSLLGTMYGGDGRTTFGLPELRGRFPMHVGADPGLTSRNQGQKSGTETNTLTSGQMPVHNHTGTIVSSTAEGDRTDPSGAYPARPEEPLQPYAGTTGGEHEIFVQAWSDDGITGTDDTPVAPAFSLHGAAPNPFNPSTTIAFDLPAAAPVSLAIYDASGRLVRKLLNGGPGLAGRNEAVWNGRDDSGRRVSSGTYLYRLETPNHSGRGRMTLVK